MTTSISLVRENAVSLKPPRSLWVTFPLGRPLGLPNDAAFQHRVIGAALGLLQQETGPVLEDYAEEVPPIDLDDTPTCPVSFQTDASTWHGRLTGELANMATWYDIGRRRRKGRTLVGACASPIEDIIAQLAANLDAQRLPEDLAWFKVAIEDAKAYYIEALTAQPGTYNERQTYAILWHETQLGAALKWFYNSFFAHPKLSGFARIVLPRDAVEGSPLSADAFDHPVEDASP